MENKTKERVGPLTRRQCTLFKNYLVNDVLPSWEEIKDAGFPFFDTSLSGKSAYSRQRFKAWACKLDIAADGALVFGATGKELLPREDLARVVTEIHCNKSQKHRKCSSVIGKLKDKYSIKRRAFGPSEDTIRDIVYSCPNPQCQFVQVAHYKQQYDDRPNTMQAPILPVSGCSSTLSDLSPGKIQGQLETAGIGTVSPTSGDNHSRRVHATGSQTLHHFIDHIQKSSEIQRQQNSGDLQMSSSSSYSGYSLEESMFCAPNLFPKEFKSTRTEPFESDGFHEGMDNTLFILSPKQNDYRQQMTRNNGENKQLGAAENVSHTDGRIPGAQRSTFPNMEMQQLSSESSQIQSSAQIGTGECVRVSSGELHEKDKINVGVERCSKVHGRELCMNVSETSAVGCPSKLLNVSSMPGAPSTSSKVFGDQQNIHSQPVCLRANGSTRVILPKELPHIYHVSSDELISQQEPGQFDHDARVRYNCLQGFSELNEKQARHSSRNTKWDERLPNNSSTAGNFTPMGLAPTKKQIWEYSGSGDKISAANSEAMVTSSGKRRPGNQSATKTNDKSNISPGCHQSLVDDHLDPDTHTEESNSSRNSSRNEKVQRINPMEIMWRELRKNKGTRELEVIDKSEKNRRDSSSVGSPVEGGEMNQRNVHFRKSIPNSNAEVDIKATSEHFVDSSLNSVQNLKVLGNTPYGYHQFTQNSVTTRDDNNNVGTVHPGQRYVHHVMGKSCLPEGIYGNSRVAGWQPKPPPAHRKSSQSFIGALKGPRNGKNQMCIDSNDPLDLSMKLDKAVLNPLKEMTRNPYKALDLSMKKQDLIAKPAQVPVASIKPMLPVAPDGKKVRRGPTGVAYPQDENLQVYTNQDTASRHRERRIHVLETPTSPTSTDDDVSEVASVRVSLYVKTPQKIARAEVVSTIPRVSPGLRIPVVPHQQQHFIDFNESSQRGKVSSVTVSESKEASSKSSHVRSNRGSSSFPDRPKKKRRKRSLTNGLGNIEVSHDIVRKMRKTTSSGLLRTDDHMCLPQLTSKPSGSLIDKDDLTPENVKANLFGKTSGLVSLEPQSSDREDPDIPLQSDQSPSEVVASDWIVFDTKRGQEAQSADQEMRPVFDEASQSASGFQAEIATKLDIGKRRGRKKRKQMKKTANKCIKLRHVEYDADPQNENKSAAESLPKVFVANDFNPEKFLVQKQIEAYEIKLKETERRKEEILGDIMEQASTMKDMYRSCLSDLGKNSLDKIRYAIQKLMFFIRDCRTALLREEATAACIEVLKGV